MADIIILVLKWAVIIFFLPVYFMTYGIALLWLRVFGSNEIKLFEFVIPKWLVRVLLFVSVVAVFYFWIIEATNSWKLLALVAAKIQGLLPGLSVKFYAWQKSFDHYVYVKMLQDDLATKFFSFYGMVAPFLLAYNLAMITKGHPMQRSLDRYNSTARPVDMDKVYLQAQKDAKKGCYGFNFLGYDFKYDRPAVIKTDERFRHIQIIGGTGSGKTASVIIPLISQDIRRGRGILFIDAKGDLNTAKTVYSLAKQHGREKDFQMFSISDPDKSNSYNPLALGNATQLKDKIIGAMTFTEVHYMRECENGLQILFSELLEKNEPITLHTIDRILRNPTEATPKFLDFFDSHKKNILGIQNEISLMVNTPFGRLFDGNEINLLEAYEQNKIVYFAINTLVYGETGKRMGRLITGDINTLCGLVQQKEKRNEFAVFIDEYATFGTKPFAVTLAQGRSAGFMISISHQSQADLMNIDENHAEQIKANCNTRIILKANNSDAEDFCNELGTYRDTEITRQVALTGEIEGAEMGSEKVIDLYHINPQELRQLKIGQGAYKTLHDWGLVQLEQVSCTAEELKQIILPTMKKTLESAQSSRSPVLVDPGKPGAAPAEEKKSVFDL